MSWPDPPAGRTDPAYYRDAADSTEAQIRADFTLYWQLREIAPYAESPQQEREFSDRADALAAQWGRHRAPRCRTLWSQLHAATGGYQTRPETARADFGRLAQAKAAGELPVDPVVWRNLRQAAELNNFVETTINGSEQDAARWQPPQPGHDRELGHQPTPPSLLDRALGGRGPELTSLAEIDAIIAETDRLLDAEEQLGDLSINTDRQLAAARALQNLTAQHTRLAQTWNGHPEHDQPLITRLESLLDQARAARTEATAAGVPGTELEAIYRAGRNGITWDEQPGSRALGRITELIAERHPTAHPLDVSPESDPGSLGTGTAFGTAPNSDPAHYGGEIADAIAAALPESQVEQWADIGTAELSPVRGDHGAEVQL